MSTDAVGSPGRAQLASVAAAFFTSSALGLLLLAVVARWLTPAENGEFLAWWGLAFAFASVVGSVEQEVARQSAEATHDRRPVPVTAVQMAMVVCGGAAVVLGVLFATPAGRSTVTGSVGLALLAYVALGGAAILVLTRGLLLGEHSYRRYALVIVGEAVLRVAAIGAVLLAGAEPSVLWAAAITVLGFFAWAPVLGHAFRRVDWHGLRTGWRRVFSTVTALALATGLSALVLTGFPAVATVVIGHPGELATLFAAVTIARVPLVLLAPVQALTVPTVVRWIRTDQTARLNRATALVAVGSAVGALVAAVVAYEIGPFVVRLAMGGQYDADAAMCARVAAATVLMAAALLQAGVLVAFERYWHLTACWALAIVGAGAVMVWLPSSPEARGSWGFLAAALVAAVAVRIAIGRGHPPRVATDEPDLDAR